jgi:hypothetical protein
VTTQIFLDLYHMYDEFLQTTSAGFWRSRASETSLPERSEKPTVSVLPLSHSYLVCVFPISTGAYPANSAADVMAVARENLRLANQSLEQARDRFSSGATDDIEVVQAQGSAATANDNLIRPVHPQPRQSVARA